MSFQQNRAVSFNQDSLSITYHNFKHKSLVRHKSKSQTISYKANFPRKESMHLIDVKLNFDILEKGLGLVSGPHFGYDFSRKIFSCYILLADEISLSDSLYFLRYRAIRVLRLFVLRL